MLSIESVAIIGAGPAGVIALDSLLKEKKYKNVRVFERRSEAGGCWIYDPTPVEKLPLIKDLSDRTADALPSEDKYDWNDLPGFVNKSKRSRFLNTATYENLHSNVEKVTMEYTNYPFPTEVSDETINKYGAESPFRHNKVIKNWIQDIIFHNELENYVSYNVSVELVEKNAETKKWDILLRKFGKEVDYVWKESFDSVIVASGRYDVPYIPDVEGLQEFSDHNLVLHTKYYRTKEQFRNKKVVVVGGSVSSGDAIQDVLSVAQLPVISSIRDSTVSHPYFGFYAFEHENIERHNDIIKVEDKTVFFKDGSKVEEVDVIIYGTGFTVSYPFLPNLKKNSFRLKHIYQFVFNIEDPTLLFVGNITAGLTFKAFEWQAVLASKYLSGKLKLPKKQEQYKWEENRIKDKGDLGKYSALYPNFKEYFEDVRLLIESNDDKSGKVLPEFNDEWEVAFWRGHERRISWWVENSRGERK